MKNWIKYIAAIILFLILLTSCQKPENVSSGSLTPVATVTPVPTATSAPVNEPTSTPAPTPDIPSETPVPTEEATSEITEAPAPTIETEPTPHPDPDAQLQQCTYINYSNGFPFAATSYGNATFRYDDEILFENSRGETLSLLLSEHITAEGYDFSDADSWFFCGAFEHEEMIYAHYDYFTSTSYSLLLKIDPNSFDVNICIISTNPRKQFSDTFIAVDNYLYYTKTSYTSSGTATTSIYRANLDGSNAELWLEGVSKETIPYLTTNGTLLYYIATDSDEVSRLISVQPETKEQTTIAKKISTVDFLYILGNYAVTSLQDNTLNYYNVTTKKAADLKVSTSSSLKTSQPMTDGTYLYVPVFTYSGSSSTRLMQIDLALSEVIADITVSDTYYYCLGMIKQTLYVENCDDYLVFDLGEQN